jgi:hypothetical protein
MSDARPKSWFGAVIILGSLWGLSEAALGMGLRSCAAAISGSLMTAVALFFMAACWKASGRIISVIMLVFLASLFKMFDALLLSLPINHGAIANPIFAFITEALVLILLLYMVSEKLIKKPFGQALLGALTALVAVNLFPLVKFATGVPACLAPGTAVPLSLYYIHVAVIASFISVPAGFWIGSSFASSQARVAARGRISRLQSIYSPATLILCLVIITVLRLS